MAVFAPFFPTDSTNVLAKGRSSGGGSISGITDNWNAPPEIKAELAFLIIWCIVIVGQFGIIVTRFKLLPNDRVARAPYWLLSFVVFCLGLGYLLWAINLRVDSMSWKTSTNISGLTNFLFAIDVAFRPGVLLWLLHIRGRMTYQLLGKQSKLFVTQFWKRIVDWSIVTIVFLFQVANMGIYVQYRTLYYEDRLTDQGLNNYLKANRGIGWTIEAFVVLLCINIIASYITLKVSQSKSNIVDQVTTRITKVALAFVFIEVFVDLFVQIWVEKASIYTYLNNIHYVLLANVIIGGITRVVIIGTLIATMKMPYALVGGTNVHGEVAGVAGAGASATGGGPIGMPTPPPVPGLTYTNQPAYYPAPNQPPPGNPAWQPPMQQYQPPFGNPYNPPTQPPQQQQQQQQQPQPYSIPV